MGSRRLSKGAKATIISVVIAGGILVTVWILAVNARSDAPTTRAGVRAEVIAVVDEIGEMVPADAVMGREDEEHFFACRGGGARDQFSIRRVVLIPADFDRRGWISGLEQDFRTREGWQARLKVIGDNDDLQLKVVGRKLIYFYVSASDESGTARITISSTSRCTQAA